MWIKHDGDTCPVAPSTPVEVRFEGDAESTEADAARVFNWGLRGQPGRISEYRVLAPVAAVAPVGDVNGTTLGSAARYNVGKPPLHLIPLTLIAEALPVSPAQAALHALGMFQMRQASDDRQALHQALQALDHPWDDCAAVFEYGRQKYAAWNWARGQAWSVPIGSAARHLLAMARGEVNDRESGLPHAGHVACNIVMLLWFLENYRDGDDRFVTPSSS